MTSNPQSTLSLRQAHALLSTWKTRVVDARNQIQELDPATAADATPSLQEFKDRCDRAENAVLRLQRGWSNTEDEVSRRFAELDLAWLSLQQALLPKNACRYGRYHTWPF